MSANVPDFLLPPRPPAGLPDFLVPVRPVTPRESRVVSRALTAAEFEMVFPRILEMVCAGATLSGAIKDLPIEVDSGAFMRWLKRKPDFLAMYEEMKEIRTEVWAGKIIEHAEALNGPSGEMYTHDTSRSKLIVDTYKWLMGADNRKKYGDTKSIEINQNISIRAALDEAMGRVQKVIDLGADDVEVVEPSYKQLADWSEVEDDED